MPQTDPFSFTFAGHPWVPKDWITEILMALAYRLGGLDTQLLAFATGIALVYTLIFRRCVAPPAALSGKAPEARRGGMHRSSQGW